MEGNQQNDGSQTPPNDQSGGSNEEFFQENANGVGSKEGSAALMAMLIFTIAAVFLSLVYFAIRNKKSEEKKKLEKAKIRKMRIKDRFEEALVDRSKQRKVSAGLSQMTDYPKEEGKVYSPFPLIKREYLADSRCPTIVGILDNLSRSPAARVLIYGESGVGKSCITSRIAVDISPDMSHCFWINGLSEAHLRYDLITVAKKFPQIFANLPNPNVTEDFILKKLKEEMEKSPNWLIVVDDVLDVDILSTYIPSKGGKVIYTSRRAINAWEKVNLTLKVELKRFTQEDCESILQNYDIDDKKKSTILEILKENRLSYLPVSLSVLIAIALSNDIPLEKLQEAFTEVPEATHITYFSQLLHFIYDRLIGDETQIQRNAQHLLTTCCFLSPSGIPFNIFFQEPGFVETVAEKMNEQVGDIYSNHLPGETASVFLKHVLDQAAPEIERYGLVQLYNGRIFIHPLIQQLLRSSLSEGRYFWELTMPLADLADFLFVRPVMSKDKPLNEDFYTNILSIYSFLEGADQVSVSRALGMYNYQKTKNLKEAEKHFTECVEILKSFGQGESVELAVLYNNLGSCLLSMKETEKAKEAFSSALQICDSQLGRLHQNSLNTLTNLSVCIANIDKNEAIKYMIDLLQRMEEIHGKKSPQLIGPLCNLAVIYENSQNYIKSIESLNRALSIAEVEMPENDPNIAQIHHGLARSYEKSGKYEEAQISAEKSLSIFKTVLPNEHPVFKELINLLMVLRQKLSQKGKK